MEIHYINIETPLTVHEISVTIVINFCILLLLLLLLSDENTHIPNHNFLPCPKAEI